MELIQFKGLKDLEPVDQELVRTLSEEYYPKIKRELNNLTSLVVHIKSLDKGGHRQRYEVTVRAEAPTKILESSKGKQYTDWDLSASLHNAFRSIESQIKHRFHDS